MAKGKKVTTLEPTNGLKPHGRKGGARGTSAQSGEVWPLEVALDMLAQAVNNIHIAGVAEINGVPRVNLRNVGTLKGGQAPCVTIAIEGVYHCTTCNTLSFAATVGEAKCERCTGGAT